MSTHTGTLTIAGLAMGLGFLLVGAPLAKAQTPAAAPAPTNCKSYGGKCCDLPVAAHLAKEAVFAACGENDATFLGEKGSKDTCRYTFRVETNGAKEEAYVEIYAPAMKEVPPFPTDPFFSWKKLGKVFMTDKAKSPKSAPMLAAGTGLWMPGNGIVISVNASTKVCTKAEAQRLAKSIK